MAKLAEQILKETLDDPDRFPLIDQELAAKGNRFRGAICSNEKRSLAFLVTL
jgi:hypothetical protein